MKLLKPLLLSFLFCTNLGYAECAANQDENLNTTAWLYKAMAATFNINFKTNENYYVKKASAFYTPTAWSTIYNQLKQQKVFETVQNRKGILELTVDKVPYAAPITDGWGTVITLQNKMTLADHIEDFLPLRTFKIHLIKDANGCLVIDSITNL